MITLAQGLFELDKNEVDLDMFVKVGPLLNDDGNTIGDEATVFLVLVNEASGFAAHIAMPSEDAAYLGEQLGEYAKRA
ncbi:hypothetical protein [Mycobacterium sp. DL440]|uniref:hypothetical protein n=1 Tax=Mycobacterium sp. DL440 TaxID=2675523 RepID=UPI00141F80F3|nr:hypothetical protein [Mycobacterium sp. DL440]